MTIDVGAYLERIGYDGSTSPTLETLRGMHRAHAYSVPFENLDMELGQRIQVDEDVNFDKIARQRRGGFCLELTGLFGRVLRSLGFRVDVIGARVIVDGRLGQPLSHMVLVVHLDDPWIADVGFGGRVIEPLRMADRDEQAVDGRQYVVANDGDHWFVTTYEPLIDAFGVRGGSTDMYTFTLQPREFDEFHDVCGWLQTSPDSRFTRGRIVSLARPNGRTTLAAGKLISVTDGARKERMVEPSEERGLLAKHFGITLG